MYHMVLIVKAFVILPSLAVSETTQRARQAFAIKSCRIVALVPGIPSASSCARVVNAHENISYPNAIFEVPETQA